MIEYIAFSAVGLFAVGIFLAIILAEVRSREEKREDAQRKAYARRQRRRASGARRRPAEPSLAPTAIQEAYAAATLNSRPQSQ